MLARAMGALSRPDYALMRKVNRWKPPKWIRWWIIVSTRGGDGWFWGLCGAILLASSDGGRYAAFIAAALAALIGIVVFRTIKRVVGRPRPCSLEPHCWAQLLPPDQFSFPSGHALTASGVAVALISFYPHLAAPLLFAAVSIALSRILLGMHFLTDVIAGALIGAGLGFGSVYFVHCLL